MKHLLLSLKSNKYYSLFLFVLVLFSFLCLLYLLFNNLSAIWQFIALSLSKVLKSLTPLLLGIVFAYLIDPLVSALDKWLIKPPTALVNRFSFVSILLAYLIVFASIIGVGIGFYVMVAGYLPKGNPSEITASLLDDFAGYFSGFSKELYGALDNWISQVASSFSYVKGIKDVSGAFLDIFIGIVASIYIERDKEFFMKLLRKSCHLTMCQRTHGLLAEGLGEVNRILSKYIRGTIIDSVIIAVLVSIFLFAFGVKFAPFLGILMGLLNIIPYFGPFIATVPIFLISVSSGGLGLGLISVLGMFVISQLDTNIIYPKIVGDCTGLHPLFILISVSMFGYFAGIFGMVLAVPVAAVLQKLITSWAQNR